MKPCARNRKLIAWLALGTLNPESAHKLRAHIEKCAGCRRYWEEMSNVTGALSAIQQEPVPPASDSFHERLMARLRPAPSPSLWQRAAARFSSGLPTPRIIVPAIGAAVVVVIGAFLLSARNPKASRPYPMHVRTVTNGGAPSNPPPTIAAYRMAASHSLAALDDLLTKQSCRPTAPGPTYTASPFNRALARD
jgi:Putative zinc-finger